MPKMDRPSDASQDVLARFRAEVRPRNRRRQRRVAAVDRREPDGRAIARERSRGHGRPTDSPPKNRPARSTRPCDSPYIKGSELLLNRLKKRDWLLAVYRKNNRLHPQSAEIERRHKLSRIEFLREYYSTNRPVIITGMMDDWPAMRKWNLDYFARNFGDREVEVQMGRTAGANYETEREKYIQQDPIRRFCREGAHGRPRPTTFT